MLSRVASSIYWMSRYLERADNVARFIDVNLRLILDMHIHAQWEPLVSASGGEKDFFKRYDVCSENNVVKFLTFDQKNPNSIIACVQFARENARTVREMITSELWETINEFYHFVKKNARKRRLDDLQAFYASVVKYSNLLNGLWIDTISHNEAWHFAKIGQMLERADKTARLLDVKYFSLLPSSELVNSPYDAAGWGAVLKSASAFEMYRKQFHRVDYKDVTQFLIFDPDFPRTLKYCVDSALESLQRLTEILGITVEGKEDIIKLQATLAAQDIDDVLNHGLHEFLDAFQFKLNRLDQSIFQSFFAIKDYQAAV